MRHVGVVLLCLACGAPGGGGAGGGATAGGTAGGMAGGAAGGVAGGAAGGVAGGAAGGVAGGPAGGSAGGTADAGSLLVVAVGYGQRIAKSTDGIAWTMQEKTPNGGDDNDLFRGVAYGDGRFVAVGGSSVALTRTSTDGIAWADGGSARAWLAGAAFTGTAWVAAGGNGVRVRSIDHALTWSNDVGYQAIHYRAITAGGGRAVAVGHTYNLNPNVGVITTTTDGLAWSERRQAGEQLGSIAWGNGVFVACTHNAVAATSSDGMTWVDQNVGTGDGAVVFAGTEFILVRASGTYRSSDGTQWASAGAMSRSVDGLFKGGYLSFEWPLRIRRSTDLVQWAAVFEPLGSGLTQLASGPLP